MESGLLWPLGLYLVLVVVLVVGLLALSSLLGERHRSAGTDIAFESGVNPVGDARLRLSAQFYQVAMFFVVFDMEAVYLYAWAASLRRTGISGFIEAVIFIGVLLVALFYLWRRGALDWGPGARARMVRK